MNSITSYFGRQDDPGLYVYIVQIKEGEFITVGLTDDKLMVEAIGEEYWIVDYGKDDIIYNALLNRLWLDQRRIEDNPLYIMGNPSNFDLSEQEYNNRERKMVWRIK